MKKAKASEIVLKYLLIALGALVSAAGFEFLLYPNDIVVGGVTGVSMIINKLTGLPIGVLTIAMNVPLFAVAWKKFGLKFIIDSLVGMVLSSVFIDLLAMQHISLTDDLLLACIIGGVIKGVGFGVIYWEGATTGGSDILAKLVRSRYPYINFGTITLMLDATVMVAFAVIFSNYEAAMYGVIAMFVTSRVVDVVLYGINTSNVCYIVSDKSDQVTQALTSTLGRGVTILHGEGAYTHREKQVLMCVVKRSESVEVRKLVKNMDEDAFLIVTDAKNVFGRGFGDISDLT
jgi:uncharacterized membrane-anchored protein YitT (DUF2179 family)